jgi:hypothetical protein
VGVCVNADDFGDLLAQDAIDCRTHLPLRDHNCAIAEDTLSAVQDLWSSWLITSVNGRSSTPLGRARSRPAATIDAALLELAHIAKRRRQRGYELMR